MAIIEEKSFGRERLKDFFFLMTGIPYEEASREEKEEVWATSSKEDVERLIYSRP